MDRRDFIKTGALAGAAVATGVAETAEASRPFDMGGFLHRMDEHLAGIPTRRALPSLALPAPDAQPTPEARAAAGRAEELIHKSMRTLLVAGLVGDLPKEERAHPALQERVRALLPEMNDAIYGMMELMSSMSAADRLDAKAAMEDDPDLPMRVMQALDDEAAALGISTTRRAHLRSLGTHLAWRMRHQTPTALMDEYVGKAERVVERHGGQLDWERRMAARLANEALWLGRGGPPSGAMAGAMPGVRVAQAKDAPPGEEYTPDAPQPASTQQPAGPAPGERTPRQLKGDRFLMIGGILMGVGVAIGGTFGGLAAVTAEPWFLVGVTVGAVLLIVGLILLIIGAVWRKG